MSVCLATLSSCVNIWNFDGELTLQSSYKTSSDSFYNASWNHTNQVIAVVGSSSNCDLIQAKNGQVLTSLELSNTMKDKIKAVSFSGNSRLLAAGVKDCVQLWDLKKKVKKSTFTMNSSLTRVTCTGFLQSGEILSGCSDGTLRLWNTERKDSNGNFLFQNFYPHGQNEMSCLHIAPSVSSSVACGFTDGSMSAFDVSTAQQVYNVRRCHVGMLTALSYSPKNARLVATAGTDGRVLLVDTAVRSQSDSAEFSAIIDLPGRRLTSLSFHENAIHTAVGDDSGFVHVYDWRNVRQPVATIEAHPGQKINAVAFQVPKSATVTRSVSSDSMASMQSRRSADEATSQSTVRQPVREISSVSSASEREGRAVRSSDMASERNSANSAAAESASPPLSAVSPYRERKVDRGLSSSVSRSGAKSPAASAQLQSVAHVARPQTISGSTSDNGSQAELEEKSNSHAQPKQQQSPLKVATPVESVLSEQQLDSALAALRYDVHREVQDVLREQVRLFAQARDDTALLVQTLSAQMAELLQQNRELREENDKLRRIC